MRRAKIVCTLGPATDSYEQIKALVEAGMDIARLNLSHGTYAEHEERYRHVRKASEETGRSVGILADLQGPKIRLGRFAEGPVLLERGDDFTITVEPMEGDRHTCGTTYDGLAADVTTGERILIDDGRVTLEVTGVDGPRVHTTVIEGGMVSDHKGLNLPGVAVSVPALSEKDIEDLRWAVRTGADVIALSFVRTGRDIDDVHRVMDEEERRLPVIAKVEKPQAVDNIDDIVAAFDGIMVARGDLGVEMPLEQVPIVQKRAIKLAKRNAKPVIVATQMLDSMIDNSRPTRAEASDVANAVIDGTDAVMLSGETSVGKYPVETVRTMARIVEAAEEDILAKGLPPLTDRNKPRTQGGAVARAAAEMGDFLGAKALVAFTQSGDTVKRLSRYRSPIPAAGLHPGPGHPCAAEPDVGRRDVPRAARGLDGRDGGAGGRGTAADRPLPEGRHRGHHGRFPARGRRLHEPGAGAPHRRGRQPEVTVVSTSARRERPREPRTPVGLRRCRAGRSR
ncbi:pyruvate kinase [Streptomyces griseus]